MNATKISIKNAQNSNHPYTQIEGFIPHDWVIESMIEFARLHVQEALKQASEKAILDVKPNYQNKMYTVDKTINKESILTAYNLTNMK